MPVPSEDNPGKVRAEGPVPSEDNPGKVRVEGPALEVRGVTKAYDKKVAVDAVSFTVEPGETFGLLGPNGAGKSSLIRMVMDILRPDSGEIRVLGQALSPALKQKIGYLPEERGLYQRQRLGEVLQFLGELKGLSRHVA